MKLISNTLFGKYCKSKEKEFSRRIDYLDWYEKTRNNFDEFLEQPLKVEMFVPCDEEGNVLEEPKRWKDYLQYPDSFDGNKEWNELYDYQQAKEKVLFEGIEFRTNGGVNFLTIKEDTFAFFDFNVKFKNLTIEYLIQYNLQLTENAVKQIRL